MDIELSKLTLWDAGMIIIIIGLIILIIYGIVFMQNLIQTVKHTNKILEDTQTVTKIAADRVKDVDKIISDVTTSGLSSAINSLFTLKNLVNKLKK